MPDTREKPTLTPAEQAELDAENQDREPWLKPDYPLDEDMRAQAVLALEDAQSYCELAMAYEGKDVHPHGMHVLIHAALAAAQQSHQGVVLVLPPEHGKSSQIAKWIIWQIAQNHTLRVAMVSAAEKTAKRNLIHARKTLVSPLTSILWPTIKPDIKASAAGGGWSQEKLYLEGQTDPAVMAYSLGADSQGMRYDIIWCDDIITRECRFSEAKRIEAHSELHDTWLNRLTDDGLAIITNNCWHRQDSIHRAVESSSFLVLWLGYDDVDQIYYRIHHAPPSWPHPQSGRLPLWSAVWPRERLIRKRNADPPAYKRLYMQQAVVADESRLPTPDTWATYKPEELPGPETGARALAYLDTAGGRHVEHGDFAALMVGIVARDRSVFVLDAWVKRTPPGEQIAAIWRVHQRLQAAGWPGLHAAWIEVLPKDEEWVRMAVDVVKKKMLAENPEAAWVNLQFDYPDTTASKESRIERLHGPLGMGQLKFPAGFRELVHQDSERGKSWARLIGQMEDFGQKGCDHDDGPDGLEGLTRLAAAVGPGLASPGSGIVGPREQRRELAEHRQQFEPGRFRRDLKTGVLVKKPKQHGFI